MIIYICTGREKNIYKTIAEINAGCWCGGEVVEKLAVVIYNERLAECKK